MAILCPCPPIPAYLRMTWRHCHAGQGRKLLNFKGNAQPRLATPSGYRCHVTIIDHHIVEFLSNIRTQSKGGSDVGKVLTDSLNRAQIQIGAQRAALAAG